MAKVKRKTRTSSKKARGDREKTTKRGKKSAVKRTPAPRAKARRGKKAAVRRTGKKAAPRRKAAVRPAPSRSRGAARSLDRPRSTTRGLGPEAGGQSGDTEGLSRAELADSESVEELLEEGQAFEAGIVSGVENARNADEGGVRTRQVPEDDVPQEYLDED
jgi:hypothetical protein